MFCLYQITNLVNGKYYIGVHCDSANTPYMGSGNGIRAVIKKYGKENFRKDILAETESEDFAYRLEAAVVDAAFAARPDTYNMCVGGSRAMMGNRYGAASKGRPSNWKGVKRGPQSSEHRGKLSLSHRGLRPTQETRAKMAQTRSGMKATDETRARIRQAALLRSPETLELMRLAALKREAAKRALRRAA